MEDIPDALNWKWIEFGGATSDDLPMPGEHLGLGVTRAAYWARYRQEKYRRWQAMYGKYRVPWIDYAHFSPACDAHYVRLIGLSITSLPSELPPSAAPQVPRLRRPRD